MITWRLDQLPGRCISLALFDSYNGTCFVIACTDVAQLRQMLSDILEGTEAAAATGVSMTLSAPISETFRADHPFIFLIQDRVTGTILFMGRVMNPS